MDLKLKFVLLIRALNCVNGCGEQQIDAPEICEDPSSLLAPINTPVVFTCKAHCSSACTVHWFINNTIIAHQHQRPQGVVLNYTIHDNGTRTHWLALNATADFNNTHLRCSVVQDRRDGLSISSKTAILLVVQYSSVIPNPNVDAQSPSSLLLQWSPPFLWPGYHIDYFNVSTINRIDGSTISNDIVNATFNEMTVALLKIINDRQPQQCIEYLFVISGYNDYHGVHPQTFTIIANYPSALEKFSDLAFNINVVFSAIASPLVRIRIELPLSVCSYQEFNYTIVVVDSDTSASLKFGPFSHRGGGTIEQNIVQGLRINKEYYMRSDFLTRFYATASYNHTFSTNFEACTLANNATIIMEEGTYFETWTPAYNTTIIIVKEDANTLPYKAVMGICLSLLIFTLLTVFVSICYYRKRKQFQEKHNRTTMNQHQNILIPNPIYDGLMYETIPQPKFDTQVSVTQQMMTTTQTSEGVGQSYNVVPSPYMSPVRYMDQPVQTTHHLSKSFIESHPDVPTDVENAEAPCVDHSISQDATCDTRKGDVIQNLISESMGVISKEKGNIVEETYIQMDPASTITHSLRCGFDEPFIEGKKESRNMTDTM